MLATPGVPGAWFRLTCLTSSASTPAVAPKTVAQPPDATVATCSFTAVYSSCAGWAESASTAGQRVPAPWKRTSASPPCANSHAVASALKTRPRASSVPVDGSDSTTTAVLLLMNVLLGCSEGQHESALPNVR